MLQSLVTLLICTAILTTYVLRVNEKIPSVESPEDLPLPVTLTLPVWGKATLDEAVTLSATGNERGAPALLARGDE